MIFFISTRSFQTNNPSRIIYKASTAGQYPVKHPAHYAGEIETIDYIRDKLTGDQFVGYCIGNVIKYVSRYHKKGEPAQDLEKAAVYLGWAVEAQRKLEE